LKVHLPQQRRLPERTSPSTSFDRSRWHSAHAGAPVNDSVDTHRYATIECMDGTGGRSDTIEVPLTLLASAPSFVTGDRAFVLRAPGVGLIEVGTPLPHDDVWEHFDGDLMYTVVRDGLGGTTGGGGDSWDSPGLSVLMSEPASDTEPVHDGWVVAGRIPEEFASVRITQGEHTVRQQPIRGHVAVPLNHAQGISFEIYGRTDDDAEELLFCFDGSRFMSDDSR